MRYTEHFRPYSNWERIAIILNNMICAAIPGLLLDRCPSAIIWRIVSVVVSPFELVKAGWRHTHIFDKIVKGIPPTFTNGNPAPPISHIANVFAVITPVFHHIVDSRDAVIGEAVSARVAISFFGDFALPASATGSVITFQVPALNYALLTTVTATKPPIMTFGYTGEGDNCKTAKSFAGQIFWLWGNGINHGETS